MTRLRGALSWAWVVAYYFITSNTEKNDIKIHLNKVKPKFACKKRDNCGCLVWGTRGDPPN